MNEEEKEIKEKENEVVDEEEELVEETETETEIDEDTGDTFTPSEGSESEEVTDEEIKPQEKMLTQSQVNELVGRARQEGRESAMRELLERYGVSSDSELNDMFGKGQIYGDLNDEYENQGMLYKSALAENALLKSKISPERWEDVKLILGGKGLDVNFENIESLIATHPEWRGAKELTPEKGEELLHNPAVSGETEKPSGAVKLTKLGNEPSSEVVESDDEKARKLFGL